jgi:RNA polymerase sigma-70 factor (TIGR02960 family)
MEAIERARSGDQVAFAALVEPYRQELHLHCYRLLGSFHDAEDALQETLLAAWRGLEHFEGRSSLRTWLYRVATTRALNLRRSRSSRVVADSAMDAQIESAIESLELPPPTQRGEILWLEPYPDALLDQVADTTPGPEAQYELREATSLAFITATQLLPPRQRAVHILRDVLGFQAREVAEMLDSTEESVTSALKRARATLQVNLPPEGRQAPTLTARSTAEEAIVERFTRAFESDDVEDLIQLLVEQVTISMPPLPFEWLGRDAAREVLRIVLAPGRRLVGTRANGQPAQVIYLPDSTTRRIVPVGMLVLTLTLDRAQVAAITRFDLPALGPFNLRPL